MDRGPGIGNLNNHELKNRLFITSTTPLGGQGKRTDNNLRNSLGHRMHVLMVAKSTTIPCMYACMRMCVHACAYVCAYVCTYVQMYVCVYVTQSLLSVCWLTVHYLNSVKPIGQECYCYTARRK